MKKEICDNIQEVLIEKFKDAVVVENRGYYVWVYTTDNDKMVMVVHGKGTKDEPLEIILTNANKGKTEKKQFDTEQDMVDYINNTMINELVLWAI